MEGLDGADVVVRRSTAAPRSRIEPRHRLEIVRPGHAAGGAHLDVGRGVGAHHGAEGRAQRRGVVIRRRFLDVMAQFLRAASPCARPPRPAPDRATSRRPGLRMKATRSRPGCDPSPRGTCRRRRRAIGIARLAARQRVEQRRAVAHRDRNAELAPAPASVSPIGARLMRPRDGFRPNRPHRLAGMRIEPPPSVACAIGRPRAATIAADRRTSRPATDPLRHGLRVAPPNAGSVVGARPNSLVLVRPTITRPARRMRATAALSAAATGSWRRTSSPASSEAGAVGHELLDDKGHALERPVAPAAAASS